MPEMRSKKAERPAKKSIAIVCEIEVPNTRGTCRLHPSLRVFCEPEDNDHVLGL